MMLTTIMYIDPHCNYTTTPTGDFGNSLLVTTSLLGNIYAYSSSIVNTKPATVYLCHIVFPRKNLLNTEHWNQDGPITVLSFAKHSDRLAIFRGVYALAPLLVGFLLLPTFNAPVT